MSGRSQYSLEALQTVLGENLISIALVDEHVPESVVGDVGG